MNETGIKRTEDGRILCESCGNDLSVDGSARFTMHLDGATFFENRFTCTKCGATLIQRHERDAEDRAWWADEDEE